MKIWETSIEIANREALGVATLFALLIFNAILWGIVAGG